MKKKNRIFYIYILQVICSCIFLCFAESTAWSAVDFSLKNVKDGTIFKLADYRNKIILITFGSIYCKPCIELLPVLNRLHENYKTSDVIIIGVDIDRTSAEKEIREFASKKKILFPFFIDTENAARKCKVFVLPTVLLIDGRGVEVKRFVGGKPYATLKKEINKIAVKLQAGNK